MNQFFFFFLRKCLPTSLEVQGNNNIPKYTKHNRIYILLLNYLVKLETPSISQGQINQECYRKQWQVFLLLFSKFKKGKLVQKIIKVPKIKIEISLYLIYLIITKQIEEKGKKKLVLTNLLVSQKESSKRTTNFITEILQTNLTII